MIPWDYRVLLTQQDKAFWDPLTFFFVCCLRRYKRWRSSFLFLFCSGTFELVKVPTSKRCYRKHFNDICPSPPPVHISARLKRSTVAVVKNNIIIIVRALSEPSRSSANDVALSCSMTSLDRTFTPNSIDWAVPIFDTLFPIDTNSLMAHDKLLTAASLDLLIEHWIRTERKKKYQTI